MPQLELIASERDDRAASAPDGTHAARLHEMLSRYLGPHVVALMEDDDVTEIYVNPQDNAIRIDTRSRGKVPSGEAISPHRVEMFLNAVAAHLDLTLTADHPCLQAELPIETFRGSRLQGFVPPITAGPSFNIRKPPAQVYTLTDYVKAGVLSEVQREALSDSVDCRQNIVIIGGTNSGKTTLANAVIHEITTRFPGDRLVVLEDTVELQVSAPDYLALRTNARVSLADLVKRALRTSPNRIIVGEVRGAEALDLLDAWATGHPGGVATLHASSADGALHRLDRLAQRTNVPPQPELVAEAVGVVVAIEGTSVARRVTQIARVRGLAPTGQFNLQFLTASGEWQ